MTDRTHHPEPPPTPGVTPLAQKRPGTQLPSSAEAKATEKVPKKNAAGTPLAALAPTIPARRDGHDATAVARIAARRKAPVLGLRRMSGPITAACAYGWFDKQPVSQRAKEFEKAARGEPTPSITEGDTP